MDEQNHTPEYLGALAKAVGHNAYICLACGLLAGACLFAEEIRSLDLMMDLEMDRRKVYREGIEAAEKELLEGDDD